MNGKQEFIFQGDNKLNTSNFLIITKCDYRYIYEPISDNVNMNNTKIINLNGG